jgi:uncharacterized protein (DUF1810 family)
VLVNAVEGRTAHDIFGSPDDLKFRSCMTLFAHCASEPAVFEAALAKYYDGSGDGLTEGVLREEVESRDGRQGDATL